MADPNEKLVTTHAPFEMPIGGGGAVSAGGGGGAAAAPAAPAASVAPAAAEELAATLANTRVGPPSAAEAAADEKVVVGDDSIATIATSNLSVMEKKELFVDGKRIEVGGDLEWADLEDEAKLVESNYGVPGCKVDRVRYPQYPLVLKAFLEDLPQKPAYAKPSDIQCSSLPRMLAPATREKTDIIFQAPTGTGKTGAFVGAVLCNIDTTKNHVQALILAPTRFVAQMHTDITRTVGHYIKGLKVMGHYKCSTAEKTGKGCSCPKENGSNQPPHSLPRGQAPDCHVLCGTVGKLFNYTGLPRNPKDKQKRSQMDLSKINFVVVDEADDMFSGNSDSGQYGAGEATDLCKAVRKANPDCRFILASATAPKPTKDFYAKMFPDACKIYLDAKYTIPDTIKITTRHCSRGDEEKNTWVKEVVENVEHMERMIIFAKERSDVTSLQSKFAAAGLKVSGMHGGISKFEQNEALKKFQAKESVVLVSTSIIGRGVDLEGVTHVVLYEPPVKKSRTPDYVNFVHMIGRCGRAGAAGTAVVLTSTDEDKQNLALIAKEYGLTGKVVELTAGDAEDDAETLTELRE